MRFLRALPLCLVACLIVFPVMAAEDDEPTVNDQAKDFAKEFKKTYKKIPESELLGKIDQTVKYLKDPAVDDKRVRKGLLECLGKASGMREPTVVGHVMKKSAELGEEVMWLVMSTLAKELKKKVPEDKVYEPAMESLGKIRSENPKAIKALTDLLKYKENDVVARAAYALSFYGGEKPASGRVRKDIFEEILKGFEGVYNSAQSNNENMKRKWTVTEEDVMEALNKLSVPPRTDADFPNPAVARKWFNDGHKKESWDAPKED